MELKEIIQSQYQASLKMLKEAVVQCPESLWDDPSYKNRFWQVSYHALFYTHFYLQPSEQAFIPWAKNKEGSHRMEKQAEPYRQAEILEYLEICQNEVEKQVPALDLEAPSGFHWLPFSKMELQLYNIRHIQQHVGELSERLGEAQGIEVHWVGTQSKG